MRLFDHMLQVPPYAFYQPSLASQTHGLYIIIKFYTNLTKMLSVLRVFQASLHLIEHLVKHRAVNIPFLNYDLLPLSTTNGLSLEGLLIIPSHLGLQAFYRPLLLFPVHRRRSATR